MSTLTMTQPLTGVRAKRIESIDLLRGIVIIIMALDHVRDYFHHSAYIYDPTDFSQTSVWIFFTRWITHFCAPVFTFLAGTSACLIGFRKTRKEVSFFLFTRGLILVIGEVTLITLGWTFNLAYPVLILQVIWSIGISMIALSTLVYLPRWAILAIGILLIAGHNLLDSVHVQGKGLTSFFWSLLHEQNFSFVYGHFLVIVGYPVIPWIGIIATGYCLGSLYAPGYDPVKRKKTLLSVGMAVSLLFIIIRAINVYGDPHPWSVQKNSLFTFLSFLNTTKYPPSLLYSLMTLGPAIVFLALAEKPLNALTEKISVFGRVPMFFYIVHIYFIHLFAMIAATFSGYKWSDMILHTWVTANSQLRGFGFNLLVVYILWIVVIVLLYPLCKWYDQYKRTHLTQQKWLSYI